MILSNGVVLDASVLLAYINEERGGDVVRPLLSDAFVSSVNWAEVLQRVLTWGVSLEVIREKLMSAGLEIVSFTAADAEVTAALRAPTRRFGLSLGDRACLALAQRLGVPAMTADRSWSELTLGVEVRLIR